MPEARDVSPTQDEGFLRREQYGTPANLDARASLHARFSTNPESFQRWLLRQIEPGRFARALDLGCGHGLLWSGAARPRFLVLADLSRGMLDAAWARLPEPRRGVARAQLSARTLPFVDGSFEAVIANHMLYHVQDLPGALAEIQRVLARDGMLFASTNGARGLQEIDALARALRPGSPPNPHVAAFGLDGAPAKLAPWFRDVAVTRYPNRLAVTEPDALVAYVASMECTSDLAPAERATLRARVADVVAREGAFSVTIDSGLVSARRRDGS
jgi:SAM-dependent methyltransferase